MSEPGFRSEQVDALTSAPVDAAPPAEPMTVPEVVETLRGAVERAGPPWSYVPAGELGGVDLEGDGRRCWPVSLADGRLLGMVVREAGGTDRHDELIRVLLRTLTALLTAAKATALAEQRAADAEREARVDALTGLYNRRAWFDALDAEQARMRRHGGSAVVVMLDIDGLKEANDQDGHLAGDLLIRRTADALRRAVRESDVVARIGGDEFAVLAVESDVWAPPTIVDRIRASLERAQVSASVGASPVAAGESLALAVEQADAAMYVEKRRRTRDRRAARTVDLRERDAEPEPVAAEVADLA